MRFACCQMSNNVNEVTIKLYLFLDFCSLLKYFLIHESLYSKHLSLKYFLI